MTLLPSLLFLTDIMMFGRGGGSGGSSTGIAKGKQQSPNLAPSHKRQRLKNETRPRRLQLLAPRVLLCDLLCHIHYAILTRHCFTVTIHLTPVHDSAAQHSPLYCDKQKPLTTYCIGTLHYHGSRHIGDITSTLRRCPITLPRIA